MKSTFLCTYFWENRETKNILSFSLGLVRVRDYDFPHPFDGFRNSYLFLKRPLVDTELNKPGIENAREQGAKENIWTWEGG
jgi:hypothetical protein